MKKLLEEYKGKDVEINIGLFNNIECNVIEISDTAIKVKVNYGNEQKIELISLNTINRVKTTN